MLAAIWSFLQDGSNREVLAWIGGAVAAVASAIWAVFKFMLSNRAPKSSSAPSVTASNGSVAAGRDVKIDMRGGTKP